MAQAKEAKRANQGQADPITNRKMSDACWDGLHFDSPAPGRCKGWRDDVGASTPCNCACHDPHEYKRKVSRKDQAKQTMDILDSGCGTIEVK